MIPETLQNAYPIIINHLIPITWTNLDNLKFDPLDLFQGTDFLNISHYIVPDWNVSTIAFRNDHLKKVTLLNHNNSSTSWAEVIDDKRLILYILLVWNSLLT